MSKPMNGVRVLEVAAWTFVPAAGAILADLGAEVIKIEPPTGDPQRGLQNMLNFDSPGPKPFSEIPNRGKRSVVLDLKTDSGREALLGIAARSDVFLTSYLPALRARLRIDYEDVKAVKPEIVYVRGSGWGDRGPMRDTGGYDVAAGWATSGLAHHLMRDEGGPAPQPAAFFDLQGASTIAGAIATALFQRERTGEGTTVDVSLMNVGMWTMAPGIVSAPYVSKPLVADRKSPGNPITNSYETSDGRWIYLVLLQADRFWGELCEIIGRPDLVDHPDYRDARVRYANREACVRELDHTFAQHTLAEWKAKLSALSGVWAPAIDFGELHEHPQVEPNGFLPEVTGHDGRDFRLVAPAMHFGDAPTAPAGPAPELGQDTEAVLMDAGFDWEAITRLRESGALG